MVTSSLLTTPLQISENQSEVLHLFRWYTQVTTARLAGRHLFHTVICAAIWTQQHFGNQLSLQFRSSFFTQFELTSSGHRCPACWQQLPQTELLANRPLTFRGDLGFHFEPASEFCKWLTSTHCGFGSVLLLSGQLTFSPETQQLENKFSLGCNCSDQYLWRQHHLIPAQTTGLGITVWFFQELFHLTTYQPDCRPQSTNCGIGSEELPGLSIVCRRYGGFQSPSFCADWSFATTLRILQYILTHCAFGGPTTAGLAPVTGTDWPVGTPFAHYRAGHPI